MDRTRVRFTFRRVRLLDPDNAAAGVKDLLDGLRAASLVTDDTERAIALEVRQEKTAKADQGTVIEIEYSK